MHEQNVKIFPHLVSNGLLVLSIVYNCAQDKYVTIGEQEEGTSGREREGDGGVWWSGTLIFINFARTA